VAEVHSRADCPSRNGVAENVKTVTTTERLENYLEAFDNLEKRTAHAPAWLRLLRENALARFCETGFPTTKDEDWRFTNLSAISQTPFRLTEDAYHPILPVAVEQFLLPRAGCRLVFVNGRFASVLSDLRSLPAGVKVSSLADELARHAGAVEPHLGHYLNVERDAFTALNTALFEDGAFVYLPKRMVIEQPISLLFISVPGSEPSMAHPRNLIVAGEDSQAIIVEDYISLGSGVFFSNVVTELIAGDNAIVSHYLIEREDARALNVSTLFLRQGRSSNVASHSVLLGGALVRNNVHPVLAGEGAECLINGLFIGKERQHLDNYMLVEHAAPRCASRQFYNGILDGHAHGVFHGRIIVHKDAQKTDAKQTNRNLLLSDDAQIDTRPQLEIYADDVKCTHGATIGQVEEEALFYLRSRGIDESAARALLLFAFASQCLDRMSCAPVREYLQRQVQQWLPERNRSPSISGSEIEREWEEVG
jgi:Fe-S cluster assembly protein SufD